MGLDGWRKWEQERVKLDGQLLDWSITLYGEMQGGQEGAELDGEQSGQPAISEEETTEL